MMRNAQNKSISIIADSELTEPNKALNSLQNSLGKWLKYILRVFILRDLEF